MTATINTTGDGNGRWTRTTLDGLGRTIKVETGYSTVTKSIAETEYDSCACSPTGKLKRSSMPYAPGGTKWWKTNTYDALGRTVSVQEADHASTTAYVYEGVTVKVTDPAGKWKKFHMNGLGQLWKVEEPRPGGGTYTTTYTYDLVGNLSGVSMPRDGTTQTRTFNYGNGPFLQSATQPENGTTAYTYNADKTLAYKVDADNRKTAYTYDSYKRVTAQRSYRWEQVEDPFSGQLVWQWVERTCELKEFFYDANSFDANYSQNIAGRLAVVRYRPCAGPNTPTFYEMYSYSAGGLLLKKRFRVNRNGVDADLDAEWTYDNDGKLVTVRYPLGAVYQHGYDEMGRPKTMIDAGTQTTIVGSATYGPAGELLTMGNETRQYNSRLQVTRITYPTQDWEYKYSATLNNGQITAMKDWTSGEEVNYAYDELKRLASAVTVGPEWGNSYGYDGFGNLLQKNVVKGSAPYMNLSIDPATNKPYSGYSAAGLPTSGAGFDNDNRMISTTAGSSYQEYYAYSPAGKRVWNRGKRQVDVSLVDIEEVWFWGVTGQRMAFYALTASGNPVFTLTSTNLYMGSKLVMSGGVAVKTDRLGSVGKFYPWGEERTPTGASGEKFATYYHDVQAAMNYADQRWHGTNGRFQVPDPYQASAGAGDPGSWNRFAYVVGDPVNKIDRLGLDREDPPQPSYWIVQCPDGSFRFWPGGPGCESSTSPPNFVGILSRLHHFFKIQNMAQQLLKSAIADLGENCQNALAGVQMASTGLAISQDLLELTRIGLRFWDASGFTDYYTSETLSSVTGLAVIGDPNLEDWIRSNFPASSAVTVTVGGIVTPQVALTANFFAGTAQDQRFVLLHEQLHWLTQMNDAKLAEALGVPSSFGSDPSVAITEWLKAGCPKK